MYVVLIKNYKLIIIDILKKIRVMINIFNKFILFINIVYIIYIYLRMMNFFFYICLLSINIYKKDFIYNIHLFTYDEFFFYICLLSINIYKKDFIYNIHLFTYDKFLFIHLFIINKHI